ncbi:MAG: hypothetical protein CMH57_07220 [Myxococcales bacterium]|nr:hypothetical protein [Myxococcales bacterium]
MIRTVHLLRAGVLLCGLLWAPGFASAHPARTSAVYLDVGEDVVRADMHVPLDQLSMALGQEITSERAWAVERRAALTTYIQEHLTVQAPSGARWAVQVDTVAPQLIDGAEHLVASMTLLPPPGAGLERFVLRDDVVLHRVVSHRIYVMVRQDFLNAHIGGEPELMGVLRFQREAVTIDRSGGSWGKGFAAVFEMGAAHILGGADHLLFLLVLLLPLVLRPTDTDPVRWGDRASARESALALGKVVTAFTVGHSLTLVLGASGLVRLPSAPVEILIAASILVSAGHAVRPLFPRNEAWIAAGFGLIHGLAFATEFAHLWSDGSALMLGLLGFNLGIEAMQLGVVALLAPSLIVLAGTRAYTALRLAGVAFAIIAAGGWLLERTLAVPNPTAHYVDAVMQHGLYIAAAFAALAVMHTRRPSGEPHTPLQTL